MTHSNLPPRHYYAMAVLAGTTLFAQVALTRLFSVVQYYHGAFLAISVALFGFAVSGVYVLLRSERFGRARLDDALAAHALLLALSIPACFYFYLYWGAKPLLSLIGLGELGVLVAGLEYALLALPFFASGAGISMLLLHGSDDANRLYATDLVASALGAVVVVPSLSLLGGPKSMLVASALAGSVIFATLPGARRAARTAAGAFVLALLAAAVLLPASAFNDMQLRKPPLVVATDDIRWNSFSMVGVAPERVRTHTLEDGSQVEFRTRDIIIDNSVSTAMVGASSIQERMKQLYYDWNAGAHLLRDDADVLIIGGGGGRDIQVARAHGQREIWALEVNPLVYETAEVIYGDFTGKVYSAPGVHGVVGDARSFVANSDREFDIILASLIDTWAASAAGAFALTENLLYTQDAFLDYYDHLADDGVLSISRWHPLETARLLQTGLEAWRIAGAENPRAHAAMLLSNPTPGFRARIVVLLMKKSPLTSEDVAQLEQFAEHTKLTLVLAPEIVRDPLIADTLRAREEGTSPWPGVDIEPATDDRPFFFNMVRPSVQIRSMLGAPLDLPEGFQSNLIATRTLVQLLVAVSFLVLLTIGLPLARRRAALAGPRLPAVLGYFACLGLGYILVEVVLIQRLILLLGKPVYSLAVILSTMLLASGLGSFASRGLREEQVGSRLPLLLLAAASVLLVYTFALPSLIAALLGRPFALRLAAAVVVVALPAFVLGMPFPTGLRALGTRYGEALVPWVWGLNGAMSVLASVLSIILAIEYGYTLVFVLGAGCYFGAALFLRRWTAGEVSNATPG